MQRLGDAFVETGRGLLTSVGLTALMQGVLCTITYFALGVPRPLVLGFLTALFSIMPLVGTPLIWIPVAAGLALTGHHDRALILLAVGGGVIALVENVVSPMFARLGRLELPTFPLVVSMFGGVLVFGAGGIILGPLVFRMAQEALVLAREAGATGDAAVTIT